MKKIMQLVMGILLCGLLIHAAIDSQKGGEHYLLKGNSSVYISVETGWQRDGMIPVQLDIQGLNISLCMDSEGRVFDDAGLESARAAKTRAVREELFRLDKNNGKLHAGGQILSGQVYEQNALRTRLRLDDLQLALELDIKKGRATLNLAGIAIPVQLRLGKESQELEIGEQGHRGQGHLFLDAKLGRLFFEDYHTRPAADSRQSNKICWAERQK